MKICKNKNLIEISFQYNATLVEIIRTLEGRKYIASSKIWTVPITQIINVLSKLSCYDFEIDKKLKTEYQKEINQRKIITDVKNGIFSEQIEKSIDDLELPLYHYQKIGAAFLLETSSSLNGDECGLGKSIISLSTVLANKSISNLIVCPAILKWNWVDEITKWASGTKTYVIEGPKEKRKEIYEKALKETEMFFLIINYELLHRDNDELKKISFDTIICDEATKIANSGTLMSKAVKKIEAKHRIALTGTPFNNSVEDIWNILDFCQPSSLGSFWMFTEKYCNKDKWGSITGYKNLNELKDKIQYSFIRRTKQNVLKELPDKSYVNIYIDFTDKEKKLYDAIKEEVLGYLDECQMKDNSGLQNALTKMIRLKQMTNSSELINDEPLSSKLDATKELLEMLMLNDEKTIVFTGFSQMADILVRELSEYSPLLISGKVANKDRLPIVELFQNSPAHKLLISTNAGEFGLNLQAGSAIIHYDAPWSISKLEQREGRIYRIGQKKNVTIYKMLIKNTIDEYVLKVLQRKSEMSKKILGDKEKVRKVRISKDDIRQMLS